MRKDTVEPGHEGLARKVRFERRKRGSGRRRHLCVGNHAGHGGQRRGQFGRLQWDRGLRAGRALAEQPGERGGDDEVDGAHAREASTDRADRRKAARIDPEAGHLPAGKGRQWRQAGYIDAPPGQLLRRP